MAEAWTGADPPGWSQDGGRGIFLQLQVGSELGGDDLRGSSPAARPGSPLQPPTKLPAFALPAD